MLFNDTFSSNLMI